MCNGNHWHARCEVGPVNLFKLHDFVLDIDYCSVTYIDIISFTKICDSLFLLNFKQEKYTIISNLY